MVNLLRYNFAKFMGKMAAIGASYGSGMGKSFPGWLFFKFGTYESLNDLANELAIGSILITGTNGKTTTTVLTTKLLSNDIDIDYSFESNTINAIATGLLKGSADLGVFEYGIRDLTHGIPDTVQRLVNPVGVVYTTISREHTQIKGIKNPFNDYYKAKSLLSENMNKGVIITNADDLELPTLVLKSKKMFISIIMLWKQIYLILFQEM